VSVRIRGKLPCLWRAIDQDGNVLDVLVQSRRVTKAAKRFFRKLLKDLCYVLRVIVTGRWCIIERWAACTPWPWGSDEALGY
jgi:transposase-like protein